MLLYRAALDVPRLFSTGLGRSGVAVVVGVFLALAIGLEVLVTLGANRLSQRLELGVRMRTLHLLPRVHDAFIQSRPTSDLAYRAHGLSSAGGVLGSVVAAVRASADLAITLVAIGLLDPRYALATAVGAACYVGTALLFRSRLNELDTRLQIHASRLMILLLDAMRGVRPVRLHGFQSALRNEQLVELERWKRSAEAQFDASGALQAASTLVNTLLVGALFALFLWRSGDPRTFVLLALWSLRLPAAIQRLVQFAQSYPQQRNALVRMLEITRQTPLADAAPPAPGNAGVAIALHDVDVVASGQQVLRGVSVEIPAGQHVAIVGPSGAGKSTLAGLLLGLQSPARGTVTVDGAIFDDAAARALRPSIAWIDPAVQVWNATFSQNFEYAAAGRRHRSPQSVLEQSDLLGVLASLEHGLDTPVGADGAFLSGGEGQRLRLGRGMLPADTRLAILDEAFRGLEREVRERLTVRVRAMLPRATLLFVSHDVRQALSFERVLVVEDGRIVEDGVPAMLAAEGGRFASMLQAERDLLHSSYGGARWRTLRVADGRVQEVGRGAA
jgi:ATP-binding cassette subfamily B protein